MVVWAVEMQTSSMAPPMNTPPLVKCTVVVKHRRLTRSHRKISHAYHIWIGAKALARGPLPRQRQTTAPITGQVIDVNQKQLPELQVVFCCVGRCCLECFVGWAHGRGPTLARCSMRLIERKVNIGKNRSSLENVSSSSGTQAESSRSHGANQNRLASVKVWRVCCAPTNCPTWA
jgi:hypothetical protein